MNQNSIQAEAAHFEIVFRRNMSEWVLLKQDPLLPFDLRFKDPEPGKAGAIGYARFVGRKTGGLIRVLAPGCRPQTLFFPVERIE